MTSRNAKEHDTLLAQLKSVLSERTEAAIAARVVLRDAVCAYVAVEHARGVPLTTVIQTVKDILRSAENGSVKASGELAVQLIDWCVEFHGGATRAGPVLVS